MFTSWLKRKARLGTLLQSNGDEDQDGLALDRILHGQSVIAKTGLCAFSPSCPSSDRIQLGVAKTIEVDKLRFTDKDLSVIGTLEYGQFSIVRRGSSWYRASTMLESSRNHIRLTSPAAMSMGASMSASQSKNDLLSRLVT